MTLFTFSAVVYIDYAVFLLINFSPSSNQGGLKLRIISLDAVKKSTSSHPTLRNAKN
ncbi:hypothetical protein KSF78_0007054 [Schistosoma japonicum]|nr:hypothetical protein KSF78_0007054 [Schistosoma japonicum]